MALALRRLLAVGLATGLYCFSLVVDSRAEWRVLPATTGTKMLPNPWATPCDPAIWYHDRVQERGEPLINAQCGDLRGDGVVRMYAHLGQSNQYIELENTFEGPHTVKDIFNARAFAPLVTFGLGSVAPRPSIFMSEGVRVREIYWNGTEWQTQLIESSYDHIPKGLVADDIRRDGQRHLFAECGQLLIDYVFKAGKWTPTKHTIRPKYKYSKTNRTSVGAMPGVGRGIAVQTDTDFEFITWLPGEESTGPLKKYPDLLRKMIPSGMNDK